MRAIVLAAGCLAGALASGRSLAAPDRVYAIGGSSWILERFGSGLVVLRARITTVPPRADGAGALLLTCEGGERRLLLDLPQNDLPEAPPDHHGQTMPGRVLVSRSRVTPRDKLAAQESFVAKVTIENGRRASLTDGSRYPGANGVMRFVRMLRQRPDRLNLLVSVGAANLTRDIPVHLMLTFAPQNAIVLDDVASACDPDEHGRTAPAR